MKKMNNLLMLSALQSADSIYMCTHVNPDGDAIGSMLAAGKMLEKMGKHVTMCCDDPVPKRIAFLPGADRVLLPEDASGKAFDLAFALDCADEKRMGRCAEIFSGVPVRMQLDHHDTNPMYAMINEVDGRSSSTGCMVKRLADALNADIDADMAVCIYTAISTDTGNFSFSNTDEETFACAAAMVKTGFDLNEASRYVHLLREEAHVRLLGCALQSLKTFADGNCTAMYLTEADYEASGASGEHSDGIINYALNMPGVKMTYLMDRRRDFIKISFRAVAPYNVAKIAACFGGGGHVLASGCRTQMSMSEAGSIIRSEMIKQIEEMK